jgi:F-type H+-transporting ATPase subunit gamma
MAKTRELVKRRKAIRNIRKITRTMELIAAAQFKRAMDRAVQAGTYARKLSELAADLSSTVTDIDHPLLQPRKEIKRTLLLVLTSNRGLCGGYNAGVLREANHRLHQAEEEGLELTLEVSGRRGISYFRYRGRKPANTFSQFTEKVTFEQVDEALASRYLKNYSDGVVDQVEVAYTKFLSAGRQIPVVEVLLPLTKIGSSARDKTPAPAAAPTTTGPASIYEFLPSPVEILTEVLPTSFKVQLFKCFLDAAVSEQIARRVTMKAATENADEMIRNLSSMYNRARQAQITKEIAEVIAGAEALK